MLSAASLFSHKFRIPFSNAPSSILREMPPKKEPSLPLTHFLCLPLVTPASTSQWQSSLRRFTDETPTSSQNPAGCFTPKTEGKTLSPIPIRAIRPLGTLHLTIGVMSLQGQKRIDAAVELLRNVNIAELLYEAAQAPSSGDRKWTAAKVSQPRLRPLVLSFTGLKSMHPPKNTSFIYTPPTDETGRLYPFCKALSERFQKAEFMMKEKRAMKLHATILNTIYAPKVLTKRPPRKAEEMQSNASEPRPEASRTTHEGEATKEGDDDEASHQAGESKTEQPTAQKGLQDSRQVPWKPGKKKSVQKLDGRELLRAFEEFEWARDVTIEEVSICEMGANKVLDENGKVVGEEYKKIASIPMPS